ncbi:potassium channel family protein [Catelliglobosispora koreensis]|uniref:potassium channel family protein n=1 Tax=Catelliglobosispora koreensis TaxID=129052 RepID=UPI000362E303|nr:NAD-binding protein [Catelliglobosispora koreensis]
MTGRDTVVVVGLGRFGTAVALGLARRGADVLAIDIAEDVVQRLADELPQVVCADGTDLVVLKQLGVDNAAHAIVAFSSRLEDSMLCTLALAEPHVPQIWAAASSPAHSALLQRLGAHRIVQPSHDAGLQTAQHAGGRRRWQIRYSSTGLSAAATSIAPQIAATLAGTGLPAGAITAVKDGSTIRPWRPGDALPRHGTILIAGPDGLAQPLVNGGKQ